MITFKVTKNLQYKAISGKTLFNFYKGLPYPVLDSKYTEVNNFFESHIKYLYWCKHWSNQLPVYNFKSANKPEKVIIMRSGGIGDLLAYSSIAKFLRLQGITPIIRTIQEFSSLGEWFDLPVEGQSYFDPAKKVSSDKVHIIPIEYNISSKHQHWFEMWFQGMNAPFTPEFGRPYLRVYKQSSNIRGKDKSILIQPRSSKLMKSAPFAYVYKAVRDVYKKNKIFVHGSNLEQFDLEFIEYMNDKNVYILPNVNLENYLADVAAAWLTVSVDTAVTHLREGVRKPGLGIFNCFDAKSHTLYYQYTKNIDVKSSCNKQPCHFHEPGTNLCSMAKPGLKVGPCFLKPINTSFIDDVREALITL